MARASKGRKHRRHSSSSSSSSSSSLKGSGLFSDIGKAARDILTRDYNYDQKLTISTYGASRVGLTASSVKKGRFYSFDISSQYKYKNTDICINVDSASNITSTIIMSEVLPSTKAIATLTLPDHYLGKVQVHYSHRHASLASLVSLTQYPFINLSGTISARGIAIGAEAGFDTALRSFTNFSAGISMKKQSDYHASVIVSDKGDTLRASYVYQLDHKRQHRKFLVAEIVRRFSTNENIVTVGGSFQISPETKLKSKLNTSGKLAAVLQHLLKPNSVLTLSGEINIKALDKPPRIGLALVLKP